ncbi:MAG: hypothetical protein AAF685_00205 [Cyanobacteria bacterium P01_C01_bin.89]
MTQLSLLNFHDWRFTPFLGRSTAVAIRFGAIRFGAIDTAVSLGATMAAINNGNHEK